MESLGFLGSSKLPVKGNVTKIRPSKAVLASLAENLAGGTRHGNWKETKKATDRKAEVPGHGGWRYNPYCSSRLRFWNTIQMAFNSASLKQRKDSAQASPTLRAHKKATNKGPANTDKMRVSSHISGRGKVDKTVLVSADGRGATGWDSMHISHSLLCYLS